MNNKVLIKVTLLGLDESFDCFIPVNEIMWKIKELILKSISDISGTNLLANNYIIINKDTSNIYDNNDIVINTDIRNGTELYFISY